MNRRRALQSAASALGLATMPGWAQAATRASQTAADDRILVIVELSGGNDGLNSVVPYADDAYYRHRPTIGIPAERLLKLDDHFGLNPGMLGFHRLWETGDLAIVHGAGYDNPSYSHFTSMAYWHTATPNGGNEFGWAGRMADQMVKTTTPNLIININSAQSLAVKSQVHTPVVFDDPERFQRRGFAQSRGLLDELPAADDHNLSRRYLNDVARSAREGSALIRDAWSSYTTPVDYGIAPMDLNKVAACIAGGLPTRVYYVAFRNNAFDTHVQQVDLHRRLLSYACDAIHGFLRDVERLGQSERVAVLAFSEFGRRVPENANLGTDHGAANVMFLAGKPVTGGHYGELPSLTTLNPEDNLSRTTDFRQVYATAIDEWMAPGKSRQILNGKFETLPVFA